VSAALGAVNAPVGSRDPVYIIFCAVEPITVRLTEVSYQGRHNDVNVEKVINIDHTADRINSQHVQFFPVSTESVGSRRELVANSIHTADATQLDS